MEGRGQHISWAALRGQFGAGYKEVRQFRAAFKKVLREVLSQYPTAQLEESSRGVKLLNSPPPISKKLHPVKAIQSAAKPPTDKSVVTQAGIDAVRQNHPSWDAKFLLEKWQGWNRGTSLKNADAAFIAWAKSFTKGQPPA